MTPLPQRKKTAEEIAKLRDQLGVPSSVESESEEKAIEPVAYPAPNPAADPTPDFESALAPSDDFGFTKAISHEEQVAAEPGSKLPVKRRSPEELEEMRRREMLTQMNVEPPPNFKFIAAHPALIGLGYLLATVSVLSIWFAKILWPAVAGCSAAALLIALFIALRRPVSRHHAGFISAIAVLTGVFTTIHHFNQLQHAS